MNAKQAKEISKNCKITIVKPESACEFSFKCSQCEESIQAWAHPTMRARTAEIVEHLMIDCTGNLMASLTGGATLS